MQKTSFWIRFLIVLLAAMGCSKEKLDFGMAEDISLKPRAGAPLIKSHLTLEDLVKPQDSILQIDSTNALRIIYREDSIYTFSARDLLKVPDQAPKNLSLDQSTPLEAVDISLATIAGAEITYLEFFRGDLKLDLDINTPPTQPIDLEVTINNADLNGQTFSRTYTLPANQLQSSASTDLRDMMLDASDGGTKVNFLSYRFEILNPQDLPSGEELNITYGLRGIEVQAAEGYFGDRVVQAPSGEFDFAVNGLENFSDGLLLTDPRFTLTAHNGYGVPLNLNTNITGVNSNNDKKRLRADPFFLKPSPNQGQQEVSNWVIDKNVSAIVPFLEIIPNRVLYGGRAQINPKGKTFSNFIDRDEELWLDFQADIPLRLRARDMVLEETISDVNFSLENPEQIDSLAFYFRSINRIPLGLELEVSFLDSTSNDSLTGFRLSVIEAAPVNSQGQAERTVTLDSKTFISGSQLDAVLNSNAVRIRARASTANRGQQEAQLYADDFTELQIAATANFNLDL